MAEFDRARVEEMLAKDAFAQRLGVELTDISAAEIAVALDIVEDHTNFLGVVHGGVIFSLADCAFSLASNAAGARSVAIDTHLVLTAATRPGDRLVARVREMSRGRTLGTYRAEVMREDGRVVGLFTGTVHIGGTET